MKHLFIKMLFYTVFCFAWAQKSEAATPSVITDYWQKVQQYYSDISIGSVKWKKHEKNDRRKGIKDQGRKTNRKGSIIFLIVLLSIGAIIFGSIGLLYLAAAFELPDLATIALILSGIGLLLAILCVRGIVKQIKKLKRLKRGEILEQDKPRRPPTKQSE